MTKTNISIAISALLTFLLFYYIISIYQSVVPGTKKWLIQGRIDKVVAEQVAAQVVAQTQP